MNRLLTATLAALAAAAAARAHFVLVVPDSKDPGKVTVVFSDTLGPDENIPVAKFSATRLTCRDAAAKAVAVATTAGEHELTATLPGSGPRLVTGELIYGRSEERRVGKECSAAGTT